MEMVTSTWKNKPRCKNCGFEVEHAVIVTRGPAEPTAQVLGIDWTCKQCGRFSKDLSKWNMKLENLEVEWV